MKLLLLPLITTLFLPLPLEANAENKEDPAWNRVTANFYLMGGLMTTCFAHKNGLISDIEKEDLIEIQYRNAS